MGKHGLPRRARSKQAMTAMDKWTTSRGDGCCRPTGRSAWKTQQNRVAPQTALANGPRPRGSTTPQQQPARGARHHWQPMRRARPPAPRLPASSPRHRLDDKVRSCAGAAVKASMMIVHARAGARACPSVRRRARRAGRFLHLAAHRLVVPAGWAAPPAGKTSHGGSGGHTLRPTDRRRGRDLLADAAGGPTAGAIFIGGLSLRTPTRAPTPTPVPLPVTASPSRGDHHQP